MGGEKDGVEINNESVLEKPEGRASICVNVVSHQTPVFRSCQTFLLLLSAVP